MKAKWKTELDGLGRRKNQMQLVFLEEDEVAIYRIQDNPFAGVVNRYMILLPSHKKIWTDPEKLSIGIYHIDKMIEQASNEEDLLRAWKNIIKEKVIDAL